METADTRTRGGRLARQRHAWSSHCSLFAVHLYFCELWVFGLFASLWPTFLVFLLHRFTWTLESRYGAGPGDLFAFFVVANMEFLESKRTRMVTSRTCCTHHGKLKYMYMWLGSMSTCVYTAMKRPNMAIWQQSCMGACSLHLWWPPAALPAPGALGTAWARC